MTAPRGHEQLYTSRLDALKARHAALSSALDEQMKYPATSDFDLRKLKIEKLKIKEKIESMRQAS